MPTSEKGGAGEPYWCGERICYKGDSKEEKDWNVEDSEEGPKNKHTDNKNKQNDSRKNEHQNKGGSSDADCQLDFDSGPCFATLPMYYYRRDSKKCEMFVYGGCGGNSNRFDSQKACQERCEH
ncbi:uncharacterized protein LOC144138980 [Haemaphysalis longicornis]